MKGCVNVVPTAGPFGGKTAGDWGQGVKIAVHHLCPFNLVEVLSRIVGKIMI